MALSRIVQSALIFSLLTSCQQSDQVFSVAKTCAAPKTAQSPIIIGNNDWIIYSNTSEAQQVANERTVAQIKIPAMMASCTGFMINADTLMTNNHCIGSASGAINVTAIFRDTDGTRTTYACDQFITTSMLYDFTLVKCANSPGLKFGWVGLDKEKPVKFSPIYVVQENCDYISDPYCVVNKYVAPGEVLLSENSRTYHNADTLPGSSGSPIFSENTHQVIALHNTGVPATATATAMNAGVPMYQIRNFIESTTSIAIYEFGTAGTNNGTEITTAPVGTTSSPSTDNCVL